MATKSTSSKSGNKSGTAGKSTAANAKTTRGTQNQSTYSQKATARGRNSATEFAQDMCKLTDKDIISDVLGSQKSLVKLYGTALCETSCEKLRNLIDAQLSECAEDQFDMFLYMNERGLYPTDLAEDQKIEQARERFCCCEQQMKK